MKSIFKTIILCGQQNIALRGHRDDSSSSAGNRGNFLALLQFRCDAGDHVLQSDIDKASSRATYTSKTIQNEVIKTCGDYIIETLLTEVRKAGYFQLLEIKQLILVTVSSYCWLSDLWTKTSMYMQSF